MERVPEQRNLVLILARAFAAQLATAVFLVDAEGTTSTTTRLPSGLTRPPVHRGCRDARRGVVYAVFRPRDEAGRPKPLESLALGITMLKREPTHEVVTITSVDGVDRTIEVAAFPLFAHTEDFVGAMALFWQLPEPERIQCGRGSGAAEVRWRPPAATPSATAATRRASSSGRPAATS